MDSLRDDFIIQIEPQIKPYILFIDDTIDHFTSSKFVLGLLIKPTLPFQMKLSKSAYKVWMSHEKYFDGYDDTLGISEHGFQILTKFIQLHHDEVKFIILDWDKTLTVHSTFRAKEMNKHIAECYFGGLRRMKRMQEFFKMCERKKIKISILTCNGRARKENHIFIEALTFLNAKNINVQFTDKTKVSQINSGDIY